MKKAILPYMLIALGALGACSYAARHTSPRHMSAAQADTNDAAVALIKRSESVRLKAYSYAGQWLIGYGHADGVKPGMTITQTQAERFLRDDIKSCEDTVARAVTVPVTTNEFSAMTALCYNIGIDSFAKSSVVSQLNAGNRKGAADAFLMWTQGTVDGDRQELSHLKTRRNAERALFLDQSPSVEPMQAAVR